MAREIDEVFIEEAIKRYQRIDERNAEFAKASAVMDVTVHSPDGLVTVVVAVDGTIRDVEIDEHLLGSSGADVSRSVKLAVIAAADAATWARTKLRAETFSDYDPIGEALMELETAGRRVDEVATALLGAARRIDVSHPPATACGGGASGALGDLGRVWAGKISSALVARADESVALAAAASELTGTVGLAASAYRVAESRRGGA